MYKYLYEFICFYIKIIFINQTEAIFLMLPKKCIKNKRVEQYDIR